MLQNKSKFQVQCPQSVDFVSQHKRGEFYLFPCGLGKEGMYGWMYAAVRNIRGGKTSATAGRGEQMPPAMSHVRRLG